MLAFLKSIGFWVLKLLLGGLFKDIQNKAAEKAKAEAESAKNVVISQNESKEVEQSIRKAQEDARIKFEAEQKNRAKDDPFGVKDWNKP
jgi:hypothetical protein